MRSMMRDGRPSRGRVAVVAVGAVIALALLVYFVVREGPDEAVVGVISELEPHRICVTTADGDDEVCAHVNYPGSVHGFDPGDCIRLERSPDEIFESADSSDECS